jgi:NAD-dependent DNA ligase
LWSIFLRAKLILQGTSSSFREEAEEKSLAVLLFSVSKKTDYVQGEKSSKLDKAKALHIKILDN